MNSIETADKPTVIFDGECRFCRARVEEIRKQDACRHLAFMPRQDEHAEDMFPQIKAIALDDGILLVEPNGKVYVAMDAMYQIGKRLPGWRRIAWLYHVPVLKQTLQVAYRIIAINRRRLGQTCDNGSCRLS